jgi:hypothetical protein
MPKGKDRIKPTKMLAWRGPRGTADVLVHDSARCKDIDLSDDWRPVRVLSEADYQAMRRELKRKSAALAIFERDLAERSAFSPATRSFFEASRRTPRTSPKAKKGARK